MNCDTKVLDDYRRHRKYLRIPDFVWSNYSRYPLYKQGLLWNLIVVGIRIETGLKQF